MDPFVRQRRSSGGGDLSVAAGTSEPDYQAALSQEDVEQTSASVCFGEMSPGTLEQGGLSAGSPQAAFGGTTSLGASGEAELNTTLPVASPFHSERVRSEVELLRSRPATLDDDGRRAGIDIDEAALGDRSFVGTGREPDYALAGQGFRGEAPRLARVEMALEPSVQASTTAEEQKLSTEVPDDGRGWEATGKGRGTNPVDRAGSAIATAGVQPEASDTRELIPDSGPSRIEQMMLQMMQENAVLRQRLEAVESQSSGLSGGTCVTALETQANSPMSFAGNVQSRAAVPCENQIAQIPRVFPGNDFQGFHGTKSGLVRDVRCFVPVAVLQHTFP
ncbi:TY5A, partial [Symbiodinium sp. CCMP2456]